MSFSLHTILPELRGAVEAGADYPADGETLSPAQRAEVMQPIYERGDRLVTRFVLLHALIAIGLATFYQTWLATGVITACAVAMFMLAVTLLPRSFVTRCLAGISLQMFVALHIYQMHGLGEMHFFFFTAFTMLIVYQDWKCMWPGALSLIAQHTGFALLHNAGAPAGTYFFEPGYVGFTRLAMHFAIALSQVGICGYWAFLLYEQTLASAVRNISLRELGSEIRRSERKFRALIAHAPDIITVADANGFIRYESPAVERVLGYHADELLGQSIFEHVHPDDRARVALAFTERLAAGKDGGTPSEFRYRHQDGSWRTLQAVGSAVDNAVGGMVINSRDVTERRQAEEAMRLAKEEAERANNAKSEFLSRMSHELRTPLNAILGFGQLLEISELEASTLESVRHIMRGGRHLLNLIDEVLAISRIEAGRLTFSLEPVGVVGVVQECLSLVSHQAAEREVRCVNHCTAVEATGLHLQADHQRLRQVLLNFLSNAVKYNRSGGTVTISCQGVPGCKADDTRPEEYIPGLAATRRLRLQVADTGYGLEPDEIKRLFVPFDRIGAEYSHTEGTGLGLALSKGLVEAMGGSIGVDSIPNEGSIFWLELPLAEEPLAYARTQVTAVGLLGTSECSRGSVLYVEDNLPNLRLVEMIFKARPGLELLSAQQGLLGLEIARNQKPDLILLDLHLPDLPGWEVLARLKASEPTRDIPVVVISADATSKQVKRLMALGAKDYLTKPIDVPQLIETLDRHVPAGQLS